MVLSLSREQKNFLGLEASRQGCGSGSNGSGKFLWKRKLEAVNGYRFHLRCSTILALNVFLTQNKQLKHTITRVCEASCCRKYPLLNSQKFYTKFYPFNTRLYRFCFQLILHSPFSLDFSFIIAAVFLCFFIALTVLNYLF